MCENTMTQVCIAQQCGWFSMKQVYLSKASGSLHVVPCVSVFEAGDLTHMAIAGDSTPSGTKGQLSLLIL